MTSSPYVECKLTTFLRIASMGTLNDCDIYTYVVRDAVPFAKDNQTKKVKNMMLSECELFVRIEDLTADGFS